MTTIRPTREDVRKAIRAFDWAAMDTLTDEEIVGQAAENPDAAPVRLEV